MLGYLFFWMQAIILQISTILHISSVDVYILFGAFVLFVFFCFFWITKIYEILFWLVLWISIFIVFQFLLINPNLSVPTFINLSISKFVIGMSIYLIFILSILVPLNSSLNIKETKNMLFKIFQIVFLSAILTVLYSAIIIWFIEKTYIYKIDNAFALIKKMEFWNAFVASSKLYPMIHDQVPSITLFWVFFVFYVLTFSDMVNILLISILETFKKMIKNAGKQASSWWGWWWAPKPAPAAWWGWWHWWWWHH